MTILENTKNNFNIIGKVVFNPEKSCEDKALGKNGWMKKSAKIGIRTGAGNTVYVSCEGGYWNDETVEATANLDGVDSNGKPKKKVNVIYHGSMGEDGTWVADNIPFEKRFEQESIDKIPYYNRIKVAIVPIFEEEVVDGEIVKKKKVDDNGYVVCEEKTFIFAGDAVDYLKANLKKDMIVRVYGKTEINQYTNKENQLQTRRNKLFTEIRLMDIPETEFASSGSEDFYFTKGCVDKSEFNKTGKVTIEGYNVYTDKKKRKPVMNMYTMSIADYIFEGDNGNEEMALARFDYMLKIFTEGLKKDQVYKTKFSVKYVNGTEVAEVTEKDLSDDMKMRIQLGLISLEDALKMYQREGMADKENVFETRLLVPNGVNPRELIEDATEDDLLPVIEESTNAIDNIISEEEQMKKDTDVSQSNLESFFGKINLQ